MFAGTVLTFGRVRFAVSVEGRETRERVAVVDHRQDTTETAAVPAQSERRRTSRLMSDVREIAFELERFTWTEPDRLEVTGRWTGLEGRRLGRPVLMLSIGDDQRRLTALPGGHLRGSGEWRALFTFDGDPATITGAELEVGRRLVVELPAPPRKRKPRPTTRRSGGTRPARGGRGDARRARRGDHRPARRGRDRDGRPRGADRDAAATGRRPPRPAQAALQQEVAQMRTDLAARDEELATARADRRRTTTSSSGSPPSGRPPPRSARSSPPPARRRRPRWSPSRRRPSGCARSSRPRATETERLVEAERTETARLREELAAGRPNGEDAGEPTRPSPPDVRAGRPRARERARRGAVAAPRARRGAGADRRAPPHDLVGGGQRPEHHRRRAGRRHAGRPACGRAPQRGRPRRRPPARRGRARRLRPSRARAPRRPPPSGWPAASPSRSSSAC